MLTDRLQNLHCGPVTTEGFVTTGLNYTEAGLPESQYLEGYSNAVYSGYQYGAETNGFSPNYTFVYNNATWGQQFGNLETGTYQLE